MSFSTTTQDRILSGRVDDHDKMYEIGCSLSKCDCYRLFSDNPLHMGFFLDSISGGEIYRLLVLTMRVYLSFVFSSTSMHFSNSPHLYYVPVTILVVIYTPLF